MNLVYGETLPVSTVSPLASETPGPALPVPTATPTTMPEPTAIPPTAPAPTARVTEPPTRPDPTPIVIVPTLPPLPTFAIPTLAPLPCIHPGKHLGVDACKFPHNHEVAQ